MTFAGRIVSTLTGKSKRRIPDEMTILGAPTELVESIRGVDEVRQEEAFIAFVEGRHACMLDWKATRDDLYEALLPLLSADERRNVPTPDRVANDLPSAIVALRKALSSTTRTLVHTESFGDFSFLIVVPTDRSKDFIAAVGAWLIDDDGKMK